MSSRLPAATTLKGRGPRGRARGRAVTVIITVGAAAESLALEFPLWRVRSQVFFLGGVVRTRSPAVEQDETI